MVKWKAYEEQIFSYLRKRFPEDTKILRGERLYGRYSKSKRKRQVDVLVLTPYKERFLTIVVECKCLNSKIYVPRVDAFAGFIDDVNVDFGMMVTTKGFSKSAINRANASKILTEKVNFQQKFQKMPYWHLACCEKCNVNRTDNPLVPIDWHLPPLAFADKNGEGKIIMLGHCPSCYAIYVSCEKCNNNILIKPGQLGKLKKCNGCGIKFRVTEEKGTLRLSS